MDELLRAAFLLLVPIGIVCWFRWLWFGGRGAGKNPTEKPTLPKQEVPKSPEPPAPPSKRPKLPGKDAEKERLECIGMMLSWMAEQVEAKVPGSGAFGTIRIRMEDPEDKKVCLLAVCPSGLKDGSQCAIQTGCIEPGTDRLHSYFVFWGTKEETIRWLREETTAQTCAKDFRQLRERCDAE